MKVLLPVVTKKPLMQPEDSTLEASGGLRFSGDGKLLDVRLPLSQTLLQTSSRPHLYFDFEDGSTVTSSDLSWQGFSASGPVSACILISDDPVSDALPDSSLSLWKLDVQNNSQALLNTIRIDLLMLEGVPDDWFCSLPFGGGWAVRLSDFPDGQSVSLRYPVQGCMQWAQLWGADEGIALQVRDPAPWLKDIIIDRSAGGVRVSVQYRRLELAKGERVSLPEIALGAHSGDWQRGARIYARWLKTIVPRPASAPGWLQKSPGWAWVSGKGQYATRIDTPFADLPERSRRFASVGMPVIQLAAWFENGHDTRYPDYIAGDSLGGENALRRASDAVREAGRHLALYSNGRLFDPLSICAATHPGWKSWAVAAPQGKTLKESTAEEFVGVTTDVPLPDWDPDDAVAKEVYGQVVFATMCPGAEGWQKLIAGRLSRAVSKYRPDGLYVDQVLGAVAVPCYAPGHQHRKPYESWTGYHALLSKLRESVKAANPDCYLATEGFSDILGQYFDIVQSHNDWPGPCPKGAFAFPEMTRHAVPWLMQAAGPVRIDQFDMLRLAHVAGSGLDVACFSVAPEGEFARQIRLFMSWRGRLGPDLYAGRPVACRVAGFPARRALAVQSQRTVICASVFGETSEPLALSLDHDPGWLLWESTEGSGSVCPEESSGEWRLTVPAHPMLILWSEDVSDDLQEETTS